MSSRPEPMVAWMPVRARSARWSRVLQAVFADEVQLLTPAPAEELFVTMFDGPLVLPDGAPASCSGSVRKSIAAKQVRLRFKVATRATRLVELRLRFAVSNDAKVAVVIGNEVVFASAVTAPGVPTLHSMAFDITRWTEAAREVEVLVELDFGGIEGTVFVFSSGNDCAPLLHRSLNASYTSRAMAFSLLCGMILVAGALVLAGVSSTIKTSYRALGVGLVASVAVYQLLGGPGLPAITPRRYMRALFARTRNHAVPIIIVLALIASILARAAAPVVGTLYRRQSYERAVENALDGGEAREAFLRAPWRREGQILIERTAFGYRSRTNTRLREYLKTLVDDPAFEAAALSPRELALRDVREFSGVLNDPAVWYVSLLLESNTKNARQRAGAILNGRTTQEARIQRAFIDFSERKGTAALASVATRIERLLDDPQTPEFKYSFLYQNGCDALATYSIGVARKLTDSCAQHCNAAQQAAIRTELDAAVARYQMLLDTRSDALKDDVQWFRPPHKLYLYHMLHPSPTEDPDKVAYALSLADNYAFCSCALAGVAWPACERGQLQKLLRTQELDMRAHWLDGTVQNAKVKETIGQTIVIGWRY